MSSAKNKRDRIRVLREEALALVRQGHDKKALLRFAELEQLEPNEPDWPRRSAECHRVLGNAKEQVEALGRAAEQYMSLGLVPKAIATCKVILSVDPKHTETQQRLTALLAGATARFPIDNPRAEARHPPQPAPVLVQPAPIPPKPASEARIHVARAPRLDEILRKRRAASPRTAESPPESPKQAPITPDVPAPDPEFDATEPPTDPLGRALEMQASAPPAPSPAANPEFSTKIETMYRPDGKPSGMFRITFPEPVPSPPIVNVRQRAQRALPTTALFSELSPQSLTRVIEDASLVQHEAGSLVYRKDDPSDALYVVVNGAVSVHAEGDSRVEIARLGEGDIFGETALVANEPRLTSVETTERTDLLRIDRRLVAELVLSEPRALRVALRFLRERLLQAFSVTNPLFTMLPKGQRGLFAERFELLQVDHDSLLVEQGSPSPGLYVLLCGKVTVTRRENDRDQVLAELRAGGVFGEMSLLSGEPAMADVRSDGKGFALRLPEWGFQDMSEDHPDVIEYLTLLASTRHVQNRALLEPQLESISPSDAAARPHPRA
jgi:CRP-like cAMP-binding protein